ncbi:M48 family metallopeptidase [Paludisphaera mucosa]|uniref:M48 family metalloprotease n=1 Tax=Paludisphaera mucosa TaxID=3030827 RepID=A0ABT6FBQ5_9BACT|nr:M48 family metallopeptidase [Paludisphaera mucosa]MDG3004979.1 M48 family metalloprotease [Paludisphaera mucosa]
MDEFAREPAEVGDPEHDEEVFGIEPDPVPFTPEQVRAAFRGAIPPKRLPASYRLWTLVVACVMVTLPLIYLAIVGFAVYAMYWHATRNHVVFQSVRGKAAAVAYFGPLVVLGTVVLFLAKPLFAKRAERGRRRSIGRDEEPALFALVDGVCKAVGAPLPVRIDVDCEVNAAAGAERGLISLLRRRLVLRIGLPLVAVFEADQFAGVLAHEFGHFAQSAGMSLSRVIRSVNAWFARVVYARDEWDEALVEWSKSGNLYTIILGNLARSLVWATRGILRGLMYVGHAVSCTMLRHMEFDADRCEALLTGSATLASRRRRVRVALMAQGGAMSDVSESWRAGRLPDDLPRLIEANLPQISDAAIRSLEDSLAAEKTGVFDTHPADRDRIAAALRIDATGVFHLEGPATAFFRDFEALSRAATAHHYRGLLGEGFEPERLQPYREVVRGVEDLQADYKSFQRVCPASPLFHRPIPLPAEPPSVAEETDAAREELERLRGEQAAARGEHDALAAAEREALGLRVSAQAAQAMLAAGFRFRPADYGLTSVTDEAARSALDAIDRGVRERSPALDGYDQLCARRMTLALGLLDRDDAAIDEAEAARAEVGALYPFASELTARAWPALCAMLQARGVLRSILGSFEGNERDDALRRAILAAAEDLHSRLGGLNAAIGDDLTYPFEASRPGISTADHVLPVVPDENDVGGLLQAAEQAGERLHRTYIRALSRLSAIVERVEARLGLPPLAMDE